MNPDAWARLVTTFGPIVYRWCRAAKVPTSDAADVVQEVFASVARGMGDFERRRNAGSFRSWIATITRSRTTDYFRRAAKREAAAGGTDAMMVLQQFAESADSAISEQSAEGVLTKQLLQQVQSEFEPTTWNAFWLVTIQEKAASDVAETLGISRASVYQAKSRVLRRLRQRISEDGFR